MKKLLLIFLIFPLHLFATDYYFSATGSDSNSGTSSGSPFQTVTKFETIANNGTISPGDHVFFKCGDSFSGNILINSGSVKNGTSGSPIIVTSYGTGDQPIFLYPGSATGSGATSRYTWRIFGVDYWQFINLHFTDTDHTNDKTTGAHCGFPFYLGLNGSQPSNNCLIDNVTIDYCGMGPVICGDNNEVRNCTMSDFKDLKNSGNSGDYGANPFTLLDANNNYIHNNNVSGGWAASDYFGFNGGFAEMFGSCSNNIFMYNFINDCNGVSEFGSNGSTGTSDGNIYAYNIVLNSGAAFYANISGIFAMDVKNTLVYNDVFIEQDGVSRFSGSNLAAGLTGAAYTASIASPDTRSFGYNGSPSNNVYTLKNNVFQGNTSMDICQNGTTKTVHTYNYYKCWNGCVPNVTLSTGEVRDAAGTVNLFLNTSSGDAANWNLHPIVSGPLWGTGNNITGYTTDYVGNPIANNMGVYGPTPPSNTITFPVFITNNGKTYNSAH